MKRVFDLFASASGLLASSPITVPTALAVFWQDKHSPFYIADRVGRDGKLFKMIKLRSMIMNADKSGVDSTQNNDNRITPVGQFIRKYKLDEMTQLINVLIGDMSLVGPRPNVKRETDLYTEIEKGLLNVRPGITDLASIVFADEGDILEGKEDPDIAYNQLIRPWKSRLALFYIENQSVVLDAEIILATIETIVDRPKALKRVQNILRKLGAPDDLVEVAGREKELVPTPPPGSEEVVISRDTSSEDKSTSETNA
jgi:lipopolysaccharide/colanic/teichoic acid biosynthesis glycosyltransferase